MTPGVYIEREVLDSEQWIGEGAKIWQVIDPSKATPENSRGIVHQAELVPIARRFRCRVWALLHGYGWLPVSHSSTL